MPAKNTSVISARVKDATAVKLGVLAEERGITIAKLIDDMVEQFENGGGDPADYVSNDIDTPFGQRVERKFDTLRERDYPEKVIFQMKEEILNGIESRISMMPKKYNARMVRDSDCGC